MPLLPAGLRPAEAIYLLTFAAFLVGAVGASLACNWALVEELRLSYHDPAYATSAGSAFQDYNAKLHGGA